MARRSLDVHGAFVLPLLRESLVVLDLGCGPGTITIDLARRLSRGRALGLDREGSQMEQAREAAAAAGLTNVEFEVGDADHLNLAPESFDLVFSHALFEHLQDPILALQRIKPTLRPGGHIALRSPDWGGFLLYPETEACAKAMAAYEALQRQNGGDSHCLQSTRRQAGTPALLFRPQVGVTRPCWLQSTLARRPTNAVPNIDAPRSMRKRSDS